MKDANFIARWSRRKLRAKGGGEPTAPARPAPAPRAAPSPAGAAAPAPPQPLPPLESLTAHSDFAPFMRPDVDAGVKGQALKTLFGDPALYPMDGLDIYIDDYTKSDPLPEGWLGKLKQYAALDAEPAPETAAEAPPPQAVRDPQQAALEPRAEPAVPSDIPDESAPSAGSMNRSTI